MSTENALIAPGSPLPSERLARYGRQLSLPGFDLLAQQRLANARVLVIGAGGLGSATVPYLASAGVGTIGIVDTDTVELSNLHRQIAHGMADLDRRKIDSLADEVARIDPEIVVHRHNVRLDSHSLPAILADYDLLLDGSDNFPTRYLASDAATLAHKPLVWGSILQYGGQISVSWADRGPTYRDLFPEPPAPGAVLSCELGGVLPSVCATIGALMSAETIKLITGVGAALIGRVTIYNALTGQFREVEYAADPSAPPITELINYEVFCGLQPAPATVSTATHTAELISPAQLRDMMGTTGAVQLVDVREPFEQQIVNIVGSELIPLGQLGDSLNRIRHDVPVVLYCHHAGRSERALRLLQSEGFSNIRHLAGGIDAYARQVDTTLATY